MRLTTVARMRLPVGRVLSCAVPLSDVDDAELPVSFDQGRHVAEGARPGSWVALAFRMPRTVPLERVGAAWAAVVRRHGTLSTAFRSLDGALRLHAAEPGPPVWAEHPVGEDETVHGVVRRVLDEGCSPFERPSHRLVLVEADDGPATLLIGADHAHIDMWSLVVLMRDLLAAIDDLDVGRPALSGFEPAPAFAEHTRALLERAPAPREVHERWRAILDAEGGVMPTFPLPLGDVSTPREAIVEVRDVLDVEGLRRFEAAASDLGVRMIALAVSALTGATRQLSGRPLRAVFPVHSRNEPRWAESVGWFITNAVLESGDPDPLACRDAVREAIALGSHPLAPILAPYGGMPQSPGMFAISWLDTRRLPVAVDQRLDIQYVSAIIRTDGVMIWFNVNETGLHLRCRYPDTPEARRHVGDWLDAVEARIRAFA